jgi:hypothetical protein
MGEHDRLDAVAEVELLEDVRDMCLDGRLADVELLCDLPVGKAASHQAKDLSFALAELVELRRRRRARDARELFDHTLRDRRREERVSSGDGADSGEELFGRVVLENETAGAGAECLVDVLIEVERREDQDPGTVVGGEKAPGRLEAVELGHADVHQDDGRVKTACLVDRLETVARFRDDFDVLFARKEHPEAGAHHRLVVGDEYANSHGRPPLIGRRVLRTKPPPVEVPMVI